MAREDVEDRWSPEAPLLPVDDDAQLGRERRRRKAWSRGARFAAALGGVLVILGIAYAIAVSQVKAIATKAIKTTAMDIKRMELTHPGREGIQLSISMLLSSSSSFPATIAPTTFAIVYDEQTVGRFHSPEMHVVHGDNMANFPNSTLQIENRTAWDGFARNMMQSTTVQYSIRGSLDIRVSLLGNLIGLHAHGVPLDKNMTLTGMEGLRTMAITDIQMTDSTQTQVRARIKTCILNPSITTIHPVGSLCLRAHYPTVAKDTLVAHLTTQENTGLPVAQHAPSHPYCAAFSKEMETGYNLLELEGEMLSTNPAAISGLISKYLSNVSADLTVVTCSPQATTVELFNAAMQNLTIPSTLPPQKDPLIGNMYFNKISLLSPEPGLENKVVGLDTAVAVEATSPLGPHSTLTISDVGMKVNLAGADSQLGVLTTSTVKILHGNLTERSNISVDCLTKLAFADDGSLFGKFVRASVVEDKVSLTLEGEMSVVAHGALGTMSHACTFRADRCTESNGFACF